MNLVVRSRRDLVVCLQINSGIPETELVGWIEAYLDLLHQQRLYTV